VNITATIIGQMLTFAVLVWFVRQFLWDPMIQMMEDRKKKIAEGLAEAERGLQDRELGRKKAAELIKDAKDDASEIMSQAQKRATEILDEAKTDAREEGDRLIVAAKAEIEREVHQAREALREKVAEISIVAAGKILGREVDANAHQEILEGVAKEI
jgi:F-type H+-transporting ATPase subunit b